MEESKLKGDLINRLKKKEETSEFSKEWLKLKILIQRDSGDKYKVESIAYSDISKKEIVKLVSLTKKGSITKEFHSLIEDLKTLNSPWSVEN